MNKLNKGFTLLELVMVITLSSIVFGIGTLMFSNGFNAYLKGAELTNLSIEAEQAIEMMARELRTARTITTASNNNLIFNDKNGNTVTYSINSAVITRKLANGTAYPLVTNISNTNPFSYYDSSLTTTTTPSNIRLINIELNLDNVNNQISLIQTVFLRSL